MNEKQINLLIDNDYKILSEFGVVENPTDNVPIAFIFYIKKQSIKLKSS